MNGSPIGSRDFSPLLKPLALILLALLLILAVLCTIARMVINNRVSEVVLKQANTLINVPTLSPTLPPALIVTPQPVTLPIATLSPTAPPAPGNTAQPTVPPTAAAVVATLDSSVQGIVPVAALSPTPPPSATPTPTLTPTPTPLTGVIVTAGSRLNIREGPSIGYRVITNLSSGDVITVSQRTPDGDWLEVETPDHQRGWVAAQFVEVNGDVQAIKVATNLKPTPNGATFLRPLNIEGASVSGRIEAGQEQWYTFSDQNKETVIIFMYIPNINSPPGAVQFFLYDPQQSRVWPPRDPDALTNIGVGSHPASDRDKNTATGELVWRGGPLVPNVRYYLRLANRSNSPIQYCLAPRDDYRWSCP